MATKQDLEAVDSVILAIMCKKLSQDKSADPKAVEQARKFKEEWIRLTERESAQPSTVGEMEEIRNGLVALKSQMAEFLAPFI
jgi:hypothetical protein